MTDEHDGPNKKRPPRKKANKQKLAQKLVQEALNKVLPAHNDKNPHDGNGSPNPHSSNDDTDWANTDTKYVDDTIACWKKQFAEADIKTLVELDAEVEQKNKANGTNEIRPLVTGAWNCENCSLAKAKYSLPLWKFLALYFDDFTVSEMSHEAQDFIAQELGGVAVHGDAHSEDSFGQANGYIVFNTKRVKARLYASWWQTAFKGVRGQPNTPDYAQGIMGAGNMRPDEVIERTDLATGESGARAEAGAGKSKLKSRANAEVADATKAEVDYIVVCHDHSMIDPTWIPGKQDDPSETSPIRLAQNHARAKLIKELRDQGKRVHHDGDKNTQLGTPLGDRDTAPLTEIAKLRRAGDPRGENRWTQSRGEPIDGTFIAEDTEIVEYNVFPTGTNALNSFRHSWDNQTTVQKAKSLKQDLDDIKNPILVATESDTTGEKTLAELRAAADALLARLLALDPIPQPPARSHSEPAGQKPIAMSDHALRRIVLRRKQPAA